MLSAGLLCWSISHQKIKVEQGRLPQNKVVMRIVQLMEPIRDALQTQNTSDIDLRLKGDLERFKKYVSSPNFDVGFWCCVGTWRISVTSCSCKSIAPSWNERWTRSGTQKTFSDARSWSIRVSEDSRLARWSMLHRTFINWSTRSTRRSLYEWMWGICVEVWMKYDSTTWCATNGMLAQIKLVIFHLSNATNRLGGKTGENSHSRAWWE